MDISILAALLKITGGLCAFLAALFSFLSVAQNEEHQKTRDWFQRKWEGVIGSPWLKMPRRVIRVVIRGKDAVVHWDLEMLKALMVNVDRLIIPIVYSVFLFFGGIWIYWGLAATGITLTLWFVAFVISFALDLRVKWDELKGFVIFGLPGFGASLIWIAIALRADLLYAVLSIIIASPSFLFITLPAAIYIEKIKPLDDYEDIIAIFSQALVLSFITTFLSFLLGNLIDPSAHVPQTLQMVTANVVFDGITISMLRTGR